MSVVEVKDLRKNYTGENALRGVSFSVGAGTMFGIIGADGAGKTTLMRILVTLLNADSGMATVLGHDVTKGVQEIRREIGYMPQKFSLYGDLSVNENIKFFADVFGIKGRERKDKTEKLLEFSRLGPFKKRRAANLSGGMKQKLALSCALIHTPGLLVLDEPTTGVDPVSRQEFWAILRELKKDGMTIIVSTPYMDEADMCDELMIMHEGKVLRTGTPAKLLDEYQFDIYSIESSVSSVNISSDVELPCGAVLMYPSGGSVHAVIKKDCIISEEYLDEVKSKVAGDITRIRKIKPSIEDLFFLLISMNTSDSKNDGTNNRVDKI